METSPPPPLLVKAIVYTQVLSSCLTAFRSPLTPLYKGGTRIKVPLFKGDLGGSDYLCVHSGSSLAPEGVGGGVLLSHSTENRYNC